MQSNSYLYSTGYNTNDDIESCIGKINPFENKDIRKGFIRKVYTLLSLQLLFTFGVGILMNFTNGSKQFIMSEGGQALAWISIVGMFGIIIGLACNQNAARSYPCNYILLSLFTIFSSYLVGSTTLYYDTKAVLIASGLTLLITFSLTLFACQTKYDFTDKGGYLLSCLIGLIVMGILNIFIQNSVLEIVIASFGAIIFSCYIVYDTQLIVGGAHTKYQYDIDDYVFAAITLYLDIVNLFLYLLSLIGGRRE